MCNSFGSTDSYCAQTAGALSLYQSTALPKEVSYALATTAVELAAGAILASVSADFMGNLLQGTALARAIRPARQPFF